jgi:acyl carrier protein
MPLPGRDADFFELGGDSLLAMKVISRIDASLHVELEFETVFEHSALGTLAAFIDTAQQ